MPVVVLTSGISRQYTSGQTEIDVEGANVREIVRALETLYPGLGTMIEAEMAIAIDGEIFQDPYLEPIRPDSEVFVLPKIGGGS
jgi:molybdopterin converting factor small subunit